MSAPGLISQRGGLFWHAKAWRRHRRSWSDFQSRIAGFLADWQQTLSTACGGSRERLPGIILLGPSGGWCLPTSGFLEHFASLVMVDPDPLSRAIFAQRHALGQRPRHEWQWIFSTLETTLPGLLDQHPHHALLFCNVLGQLRYQTHLPMERIEFELGQLKTSLAGRHWASFHDRISGEASDALANEHEFFAIGQVQSQELAKRVANAGEWLDHLTENVLPRQAGRRLIRWPISKHRLHWVEAGWVAPEQPVSECRTER